MLESHTHVKCTRCFGVYRRGNEDVNCCQETDDEGEEMYEIEFIPATLLDIEKHNKEQAEELNAWVFAAAVAQATHELRSQPLSPVVLEFKAELASVFSSHLLYVLNGKVEQQRGTTSIWLAFTYQDQPWRLSCVSTGRAFLFNTKTGATQVFFRSASDNGLLLALANENNSLTSDVREAAERNLE